MTSIEDYMEVQHYAEALFAQGPDWVTFFREILGLEGVTRSRFRTPEALQEFERSETFREIQQMLASLRGKGPVAASKEEPTRVITVRLPKSLHETLRVEAHEHRTSMNKLCISKLLQFINDGKVPGQTQASSEGRARRHGRLQPEGDNVSPTREEFGADL